MVGCTIIIEAGSTWTCLPITLLRASAFADLRGPHQHGGVNIRVSADIHRLFLIRCCAGAPFASNRAFGRQDAVFASAHAETVKSGGMASPAAQLLKISARDFSSGLL